MNWTEANERLQTAWNQVAEELGISDTGEGVRAWEDIVRDRCQLRILLGHLEASVDDYAVFGHEEVERATAMGLPALVRTRLADGLHRLIDKLWKALVQAGTLRVALIEIQGALGDKSDPTDTEAVEGSDRGGQE